MDRPASDYAQSGLHSPDPALAKPELDSEPPAAEQTSAAAAAAAATAAQYPPQPEVRPAAQYPPQTEVRPVTIPASNTPQSDYGLNPPSARSSGFPEYLPRQPQYHHPPNTQPGGAPGMAQATSPSHTLKGGQQDDHRNPSQMKSDPEVPIDPSIAASSPTYPPPYSPYNPQGHEMAQYQGHPPPPQMYARPEWAHQYGQHQHGLPGPYSSPATTVSSAPPAATAGPRPGQVRS